MFALPAQIFSTDFSWFFNDERNAPLPILRAPRAVYRRYLRRFRRWLAGQAATNGLTLNGTDLRRKSTACLTRQRISNSPQYVWPVNRSPPPQSTIAQSHNACEVIQAGA
jgi:hypothetical protein